MNLAITLKSATYLQKEFSSDEIKSILKNDIVFSFRTHKPFALLLFIHDVHKNFIQIHIADGTNVVLIYNFHQKIIVRKIDIGKILTNGHPVQIKIAHQQNHTLFTANKDFVVIPLMKAMKDNRESSSDTSLIEIENDQMIGFKSTVSKNQMFIGGIESSELIHSIPGFIGCIQGLMIGEQLLDLKQWATEIKEQNTTKSDHIKVGCKMLCDDMPCNNGGTCTEDWEHESTICD
ncbi:axotactin-like protein, partial [Euroglyphus maynei]